jgi:hypothetical protein
MFCLPRLVFGDTEGVRSSFHVLRSSTRFLRCRLRRVPFSCFALPDSFSAVPRASGPIFMFCAPGLVFAGTEGVGARFHVWRARTHFRRYRGRRDPFSCFARRTHFFLYRGRRVPFSCFAPPDSFSTEPRASAPVYIFLRACTRFLRYRGLRVPFSCFACPDSFSAVQRASGPVFMFCVSGLVFCGVDCVGSGFHVWRAQTHFRRYGGGRVLFSFFERPDSFSTV